MGIMPIIIALLGGYFLIKGIKNEEKLIEFEDNIFNKIKKNK